MLNVLIPYIDQGLTEFKLNYGLAELVTEVRDENARTFPAVYTDLDNYVEINIEKYISYHRIDGQMTIQETEENTRGCTHGLNITYPMLLIGILPRESDCSQYASDIISNGIASKIKQIKFPKEIKALVKAWSVETAIRSVSTDRDDIWKREYQNVKMQAGFDKAYFAISYEIQIKADSGCLNLLDCTTPIVIPPNCEQISIIPNERLRCLTQEQVEYIAQYFFTVSPINIVAPIISATNYNYGSTLSVSTGQWIGNNIVYTYQWYRAGVAIIGATNPTYQLGLSDISTTSITAVVTGTNLYGSSSVMALGITPTLLSQTSSHYQRVIADSGILADFTKLNTLFGNSHVANDLVCVFDPGVWGYKFNNPKVSKVYSRDAASDISQGTTTIQPLLLDPSLGRFARVRTDNAESDISTQNPVYSSQGPQILQCKMSPTNGARGAYLSTPPSLVSVSMEYQTSGNQLNYVLGGSGFSVSLGSFIPADPFYIRGYYEFYPIYKIDVSNDGSTWVNVHSASHTQAGFTITKFGLGRATLATNGPAQIYDSYIDRGVRTLDVDFANFNPIVHSRQWTNNTGLTFSIASISTSEDIYPTQVVTELTCAFDGVTDKMQSGVISFPSGALTIYAIIDWGMIQAGTRYCIDDTGGNVSIWTDGTNIFVGDSVNFINAGAKPNGVRMLTFVKNGALSSAQINQGSVISGNGGSTMPTNIIVGGKTGVNTNNATLTRHKIYAFNGADSAAIRAATQTLLNSIQPIPLF